ncbi:hypothetical protein [uncultured Desulfosarcina sp.]|uniref:hypothetical protein n=1 Tax=uncultured Desulfosarcina sp. TaxID=218289 RepID=UPI0029C7FD44|nr:hypothetical protein [uncultured Desulfosarcina sp.]
MADFKMVINPFAAIVASMLIACVAVAAGTDDCGDLKYRDLAGLLGSSVPATEFVALTDFKDDYEKVAHQASIDYLNANPQLVQRIRDDLGCQDVQWRLEGLSHRLLYAPEQRENVAELFTGYCQEAIADLLDRTGLPNPYCSISTVVKELPNDMHDRGVKAVIVNDLAREYEARYQFSGSSDKHIDIDLSGRIPLNEVGSYASYLQYSEKTRSWQFTRDRRTVWKCASANPYTVLMTPLEETLHIALRKHTERAILETIEGQPGVLPLDQVKAIVEEWLAVEEAVVGGLVHKLAPDVVIRRIPDLPVHWIRDDLATKARFQKYRLLPEGIAWVETHGLKGSICLYAQDPMAVRARLSKNPG